jgi:hypothetical protein
MPGYALLDGFTDASRDTTIRRLKRAIADVDGVIVDFAFFANSAIRLSVELAAGALGKLRDALELAGVHLFEGSERAVAEVLSMTPSHPVTALLHVTLGADRIAKAAPRGT